MLMTRTTSSSPPPRLISCPFPKLITNGDYQHFFVCTSHPGGTLHLKLDEEATGESGSDQHGHHRGGTRRGRRRGRRPGAGGIAPGNRADRWRGRGTL